jgi:hypothetical protein
MASRERLVEITVCPRESGTVRLPVGKGSRRVTMNARALARHLERLIEARDLDGRVWVREGCAGGCWLSGPNVTVECFAKALPGELQDHIAIERKTYTYSLASLDSLSRLIDENVGLPRRKRAGRSARQPRPPG